VIFAEGLADLDYMAKWCLGAERLEERVKDYPPQRAEELTGVPAEQIVSLARDYAAASAPFIRLGWGPARQPNGGMAIRTVACLPAVVGALAKPGGGLNRSQGAGGALAMDRLLRADLAPPGARAVNMVELGRALNELNDPPVKLLYVYLSNPAVVAPDTGQVVAGLMREDLFTVVHELMPTETTRYADVVLPGASFLEMTDLYAPYGHNYLQMARPVISPVGQGRAMLEVFQELAGRLGFGEEVFSASEEEIISWLLDSGAPELEGVTMDLLAQGGPVAVNIPADPYAAGFKTPSGKAELMSPTLAVRGLDPLPSGEVAGDPEEGLGRPLALITPPHRWFLNSTFSLHEGLAAKAGPPSVLLHPDDARARGIAHGDEVRLSNGRGQCVLRAQVAAETLPGVAVAEGLYAPAGQEPGPGVNRLTSQRPNDLGGSSAFHGSRVEVELAD